MAFDPADPRVQQIAGTVVSGLANLFAQCLEIYRSGQPQPSASSAAAASHAADHALHPPPPMPPPPPLDPSRLAIRPQNVPSALAASLSASDLPPAPPPADEPPPAKDSLRVPTWGQLINLYGECAAENRQRNFKPSARAVAQNVAGIRAILRRLKIRLDEPYTTMTRRRISELENIGIREGRSRATIQSWRGYLKSITARWAVLMYEDRGWNVSSIITQPFNIAQKAYEELPAENAAAIDAWIAGKRAMAPTDRLAAEQFKFLWILRNTAARNGDALRFVWENFTRLPDGTVRSAYVPNKTSLTSLRKATWTFSAERFSELDALRGGASPSDLVVGIAPSRHDEFQRELNREIRPLLPEGRNKGLYELRKMRITEVYKKYGREAAVRISGDAFSTLEMSYADRSAGADDQID